MSAALKNWSTAVEMVVHWDCQLSLWGCGCGWSFGRSYRVGHGAGGSVGSNLGRSWQR